MTRNITIQVSPESAVRADPTLLADIRQEWGTHVREGRSKSERANIKKVLRAELRKALKTTPEAHKKDPIGRPRTELSGENTRTEKGIFIEPDMETERAGYEAQARRLGIPQLRQERFTMVAGSKTRTKDNRFYTLALMHMGRRGVGVRQTRAAFFARPWVLGGSGYRGKPIVLVRPEARRTQPGVVRYFTHTSSSDPSRWGPKSKQIGLLNRVAEKVDWNELAKDFSETVWKILARSRRRLFDYKMRIKIGPEPTSSERARGQQRWR